MEKRHEFACFEPTHSKQSLKQTIKKQSFGISSRLHIKSLLKFSLVALSLVISSFSFASHFRSGSITATRLSETATTATYRLNYASSWRLGSPNGNPTFSVSGGNSTSIMIPTVDVTDPSGGWTNSVGSAVITLNKTTVLTRIEWTSCCKISTIANNHDMSWDVYTIINTGASGSSPVSTLPAIINMPINAPAATYTLPASDPDAGATLTYGTPSFTGGLAGQVEPSGFSINPTTGLMTLNTVGKLVGQQYNAMVTVRDNNGNMILIDFLINMVGASTPPVFDYSITPTNGFVYNVMAGQNLTFPISARDNDAGSTVSLSISGLPTYITTANFTNNPLPATANPSHTTFSWTPTGAQIGSTIILNIIATDNVGVQSTSSVTIRVVAEPAPVFVSPTPLQSQIVGIETGNLYTQSIVASSSLNSNVSIAFVTGLPSGAVLTPSVPTAGANPGQTQINWNPIPSNFGLHTVSFQATIAAFPTIFTTRSYQIAVNTLGSFSSTPITSVLVGQFYSYNVTVNDLNIPYGDVVDIVGAEIPSWLTLVSTGNGTAVLSGTPTAANIGSNEVHLHAEDIYHHSNSSEVTQEFIIQVIEPTPNAICKDASVSLDQNGNAVLLVSDVDGGSNSLVGISNMTVSPSTLNCSNVGVNQVTLTVTNSYGTQATCQANVTVIDAIAPVISCSSDVTAFATSASGAVVNYVSPVGTDNCSSTTTLTAGLASGSVFPIGTTTVTYTVTDASGLSVSCSFEVTISGLAPVIVCPSNIVANTTSNCNADVTYSATETTGIPASVITYSIASGSTFNVGTTTVTATATNAVGTSSCTFDVTVIDAVAPVAIAQDVTVQLDASGNGSITTFQVDNGSNDACGVALSVSPSTFDCSNVGSNPVVLTVTDANGNVSTANAVVTVIDAIAPVVLTHNVVVELNANGHGSISVADVDNGSTDACGLSLTVSPNTFDCTNFGDNVVTLTATDVNGNVSSETAVVTVVDHVAPVVVTQNISINLDALGAATITASQIENGSTDACGISTFTLDNYSFNCSNVGVNNVVALTVTDIHGNISSANATVTVSDITAANVTTQDITVQVGVNGNVSITASQINNGSADACGIASMTVSPSSFYCENVGANTVVLTVTDIHGNVSSASAVVTVQDLTVPVVLTQNAVVYLGAKGEGRLTESQVNNGSYDICGISTVSLSNSAFNCSNVGENTVTLTVTDVNGNVSSNTAVVTVVDAFAPFVYTNNIIVNLDATGNTSITPAQINNNSFDACGIATYTLDNATFNCGNVGPNTVTLTVTDIHGNVASATAVVTVNDVTAPIANCKNVTVTIANGTASINAAQVDNGSTDACGIATMTVSPSTFNCGNIGNNPVVLTVTDVNGNVSTCQANVTVNGVVPSCTIALSKTDNTFTGGVMTNLYLGYGSSTLTLTSTANGAGPFTYSWSGQSLSTLVGNVTTFAPKSTGLYTLTCTATNSYGCQTTCSVVICVKDIRVPNQAGKVYLCHVPNGNPANKQTLSISTNAVNAHLTNHAGDQLGACDMSCGDNKSLETSGDMYSEMTTSGDVDLIVYPNPSHGTFNFTLESESTEAVSIKIYDLTGSIIFYQTNLTANEVVTLGNDFSVGLFMAEVTQGEFTKVVKLTKVH